MCLFNSYTHDESERIVIDHQISLEVLHPFHSVELIENFADKETLLKQNDLCDYEKELLYNKDFSEELSHEKELLIKYFMDKGYEVSVDHTELGLMQVKRGFARYYLIPIKPKLFFYKSFEPNFDLVDSLSKKTKNLLFYSPDKTIRGWMDYYMQSWAKKNKTNWSWLKEDGYIYSVFEYNQIANCNFPHVIPNSTTDIACIENNSIMY